MTGNQLPVTKVTRLQITDCAHQVCHTWWHRKQRVTRGLQWPEFQRWPWIIDTEVNMHQTEHSNISKHQAFSPAFWHGDAWLHRHPRRFGTVPLNCDWSWTTCPSYPCYTAKRCQLSQRSFQPGYMGIVCFDSITLLRHAWTARFTGLVSLCMINQMWRQTLAKLFTAKSLSCWPAFVLAVDIFRQSLLSLFITRSQLD